MRFLTILCLTTYCAISQAQPDSVSVHALNQRAYNHYLSASDSAVVLAQRALEQATALKLESEKGWSYLALSKAYWAKSNFFLSTRYGFDAVYAFENSPFTKERSLAYLALGRTLVEIKNKSRAHEFLKKAARDAIALRDTLLIAECYREYSFLFAELQQYDSALWYADRGIELFSQYNEKIDISILYGRKSRIYFDLADYEKSKEFAYKGILTDSLSGNIRAFAVSKFFIAQSDFKLGNRAVAMKLVREATQLFESIHNHQWLVRCHQLLADLYRAEGNQRKLVHELELISACKDSLYNAEKSGQAEEMQALYDLSSKETTIQLLEKENQLQQQQVKNQRLFAWILTVSVLLLLAVVFFLFRLRKLQQQATQRVMQQKEEIEAQARDLEKLNQLKNKLFSVIGHDLRGPINNLKIILDLISSNKISQQDFINITDKLRSNLDTTQRTLENLLSWSMTQMEGIKVDPQRIGLGYSIDEACLLLHEVAASKNISIVKNIPEEAYVLVDLNHLRLILRNLLHNAIKFSTAQSAVTITAVQAPSGWKITIQDTGIGMTEQEISMVLTSNYFTKYGTSQEKGTGLGLMLCQEFLRLNHGKLEVVSKPQEGTSISIYLPVA